MEKRDRVTEDHKGGALEHGPPAAAVVTWLTGCHRGKVQECSYVTLWALPKHPQSHLKLLSSGFSPESLQPALIAKDKLTTAL